MPNRLKDGNPEHFRHIIDSVADGVFTVDRDMHITSFNRAAEILTGIKREDAINRPCHEVFRTSVCDSACPVREAIKKGKPVTNREVTITNNEDNQVPVSVSASILYDDEGNPIGGVETMRSMKRIYAIMDSVADGLFTVDEGMHITHFNKAAEEITGVSAADALGKPCYEIFKSEACTGACPMVEAIATGQSIQREVDIVDLKGRKKLISVSASTLYDALGNVMGGVETVRDLTPINAIKEEIREKYSFRSLVSRNPAMRRLFDVMEDIAASNATVFLHGESGTGKELFARAIHDLSPRREGPMVIVNCGALPETLLESEIFGVRKGAFTGATENRPGRLEMCNGGTFFLDEIGDLPLPLQVKLLRVLENHEFQPLGARSPIKADVRFITATHRNLEEMVAEGTFRQDLFFRINIVTLHIPPLRDRREDIPLLVDMALQRFNLTYNKKVRSVAPEVLKLFLAHSFPGNVRELLNLIEQSVILCRGTEITLDHLPTSFLGQTQEQAQTVRRSGKMPTAGELQALLNRYSGNRIEVARELNIDRTTLWRWMKRLGVKEG
ncbi:MAG: PAS domain-containing protein [Geobacter sp.]|nr:PAS domain-containing protein [Geobacter sp.]